MGTPVENIDVVIIGAGPAGLASCYAALQANKKVLVIDAGETTLQFYASTLFDERFDGRITGGLGGAAKLWGAQSGFLDKSTLEAWRHAIGFKDEFIDSLQKAREEMNEFLEIAVRPDNFYEIEKENELRQLALKYGLNLRHTIYPKNGDLEWHWGKIIKNPKIDLILNERLIKISHQDSKDIALSFESGLTIDLGLAKLILAAGTVSTTEIILKSYPIESKQFGIGWFVPSIVELEVCLGFRGGTRSDSGEDRRPGEVSKCAGGRAAREAGG